jgi:hypothetical protein
MKTQLIAILPQWKRAHAPICRKIVASLAHSRPTRLMM